MNKYIKTPNPPKEVLENLYHGKMLSQSEVGIHFGVSQRIVFRWFRDLGIESRKPYKRNQIGPKNSSWKGDNATYAAFHYRVISARGRPQKCDVCGTADPDKVYDWANLTGAFHLIEDYERMCRSCHWTFDKKHKNLGKYAERNGGAICQRD